MKGKIEELGMIIRVFGSKGLGDSDHSLLEKIEYSLSCRSKEIVEGIKMGQGANGSGRQGSLLKIFLL
jgi:hypothetical protein